LLHPACQCRKSHDIRVTLQAYLANDDDWCTPVAVDGFEAALKGAGKSATPD
jgi:carboxymethylenebutenolidase